MNDSSNFDSSKDEFDSRYATEHANFDIKVNENQKDKPMIDFATFDEVDVEDKTKGNEDDEATE